MDEFVVFLIVGLLAITAMAMVFVGDLGILTPSGGSNYGYYYNRTFPSVTTTTLQLIGKGSELLVGPRDVETWRSVILGNVNASYLSGDLKYSVPEKYLFNGLLFGGNDLKIDSDIDTSDLIGAFVRFDVDKSNDYGKIIIKMNGNVVADEFFSLGTHDVVINKSYIGKTNRLEIIPTSSYWKIWAPAVYSLKNIELVFQSHYSKPSSFKFNIYREESDRLSKGNGRLILDFPDHNGILKVNINDREIFSNQSSGYQYVPFDQSVLRYGENTINFYADQSSLFQGRATIIFYYMNTEENSISKEFIMNQTRYNNINNSNGQVVFTITKIPVDGGFSLSIEDAIGNKRMSIYEKAVNKTYVYNFNSNQCVVGKNVIRIKSVDKSVFYVDNISINI